jgi:hypothetical protein
MKQDLLVLWDQANVVDVALLLVMSGDAIMNRRDLAGSAAQSNSRHSMSATCGPQDMISLVTPSLGGNISRLHNLGKTLEYFRSFQGWYPR